MGYDNIAFDGRRSRFVESPCLAIVGTPDEEASALYFSPTTRHRGNLEAARQYIAWETGLVKWLDTDERAVFAL